MDKPKRSAKEVVKRYAVFLLGLIIVSFGIAFSKKSALGTTPVSVIPNTLSIVLPVLTIGGWTILFSIVLVLAQIPILKGKVNYAEIGLEIVISLVFGSLVDVAMWCLSGLNIEELSYIWRLAVCIGACFIVGFGVYVQLSADVIMLPGDAFCRSIAKAGSFKFSTVRTLSDLSMTLIAVVISLSVPPHELQGVREGTFIAALLVGNTVKLFTYLLKGVKNKIFPVEEKVENLENTENNG